MAWWPFARGEVHADRQQRRPGAQASVAGPAGSVVRSPKNSTSTPLPIDVAIAQQAHDLVVAECPQHRPARPSARAARRSCRGPGARSTNHSNSSGRLERLDDDGHLVALVGQPAPGPLPATEVRQGEDRAVALRRARPRCAGSPSNVKPRVDARAPTATAAGSSRPSSGRSSRRPAGRHGAAPCRHVGLTRCRCRSTIARRHGKPAPNPIGAATPRTSVTARARSAGERRAGRRKPPMRSRASAHGTGWMPRRGSPTGRRRRRR